MTAPTIVGREAKRGDLIAIASRSTYSRADGQRTVPTERWDVEIVAGVTREGLVRTTRRLTDSADVKPTPLARRFGVTTWRIIPADDVDVDACIATVLAHHYPGHPDQPQPYSSRDELADALRRFRR